MEVSPRKCACKTHPCQPCVVLLKSLVLAGAASGALAGEKNWF
jgi:hypothetical protein